MNAFPIRFKFVAHALMIAFVASLLSACGTTPLQYRKGDFVSNMASNEAVSRDRATERPVAAQIAVSRSHVSAPAAASRAAS